MHTGFYVRYLSKLITINAAVIEITRRYPGSLRHQTINIHDIKRRWYICPYLSLENRSNCLLNVVFKMILHFMHIREYSGVINIIISKIKYAQRSLHSHQNMYLWVPNILRGEQHCIVLRCIAYKIPSFRAARIYPRIISLKLNCYGPDPPR